ncbi:hypothetical protein A9G22_03400 [Gilliamella sp. App2-1]|uniref:hypothetical protein n=1 Tax=Gilliamella sp. App2-1 TaxID=3120230 RepID=UPI00082751FE|nr:hypothetical protein [Gilliamella apicola]OCG24890.1 hypothetical protein A9G22_03400 [Gilliamella apicola]
MQYYYRYKYCWFYVLNISKRHFGQASFLILLSSSKVFLSLALLLLLLYSLNTHALSAITTNEIEGSAPYLTFDGGRTKISTTKGLLGITLSDGTRITPSNNTSSSTNPIELPQIDETFADIDTLVPTSKNFIDLNSLVSDPYNHWGDDDDDGQEENGVKAQGYLYVYITDKNNKTVNRSDELTLCNAPYKMVLISSEGSLKTQYGLPNSISFSSDRETYYITPKSSPVICYAKPSLKYGGGSGNNIYFAGPTNIWSSTKGFIPQSTTPTSYDRNFPTTGAHNLYFDLDIVGSDALTWAPVTHEGITASMTPDSTGKTVRVTLTGPEAKDQWNNDNPNRITKPILPQTFELVGRDSSGNVIVKYGFTLQKWFAGRGDNENLLSNQAAWCRSLGYRLVQVKDITNSNCNGGGATDRCRGAVGATPISNGNHYQRYIGAGFFAEWGILSNYSDANFFSNSYYWTSDVAGVGYQFFVRSNDGSVSNSYNGNTSRGLCVTP